MLDFRPPKRHTAGYRLGRLIHRWVLRYSRKGLRVVIGEESLGRLREAYKHHCVLLPNHRNDDDVHVLFSLRSNTPAVLLPGGTRTLYRACGGEWRSLAMQHMGCYSVVRGAADRASFRMTRDLIASGNRPVVIFPEGAVSHRTDTVMPFQEGIFKLAFWALQDVLDATENEPVLLVPIGIHYVVSEERTANLHTGLTRLERALLGQENDADPLTRIRLICHHMLEVIEDVHYGASREGMSISERTTSLRTDILEEMERFLQLHPRDGDALLDRARAVRNRLDEEVYADTDSTGRYARAAHERRVERLHGFYDAVKHVCAFDAVDILTVDQDPSLSTLFEMLWMLETEVFGAPKSLVPRTAEVRVGDPVLINDHYEAYLDDKRDAVESVTKHIESAVTALLK